MSVILATGPGEADRAFAGLDALARWIVTRRAEFAGRPDIRVTRASVARGGELPDGACLSVRVMDGSNAGRGHALGYLFIAHPAWGAAEGSVGAVLDAIAVAQRLADRAGANGVRPAAAVQHA